MADNADLREKLMVPDGELGAKLRFVLKLTKSWR